MRRGARSGLTLGVLILLAAGLPIGGLALAMWPQSTVYGRVISHGDRSRRMVALTFDDGPNAPATREIIGILENRSVRATFFMTGAGAAADPETVRAAAAAGNVIGSHSFRHQKRDAIFDYGYAELSRAQRAIFDAAGVCPALFRPPNGFHTPWQLASASHRGLTTVAWDVQTNDWEDPPPETIVERALGQVEPGSIILLHDGSDLGRGVERWSTVEALPLLIDALRTRGYELVTVDELLGVPAYGGGCG